MKLTIANLVLGLLLGAAVASSAAARDVAAGAAKAKEVCASCHGVDGNSTDGSFPRLAGQYEDYLAKALRDYRSGDRNNAIMKGFAAALTDQDIRNLAAFYARQRPVLSARY